MGQFSNLFDESPKPNPSLALSLTADANPAEEAEYLKLSKRYKVPVDVVRTLPDDYKVKAKTDDVMAATANAPKLRGWLSNTDNARLAADDTGPLSKVEEGARKYGEIKAWNGPEPTAGSVLSGLAQSFPQGFRAARAGMQQQMSDLLQKFGLIELNDAEKLNEQRQLQQAMGASAFTTPDFESSTAQGVYGGLASTLRAAPGLALSVATRSPTPALAAIGVQTQAESYGKYRARGGTPGEATVGAIGEAAVEVGTEFFGVKYLAQALGKTGMGEFFVGLLAREVPGEQLATVLQDAIDTAIANPDKTWEDYLNERPDAAYQTFIATLTQAGVMSGVNTAVKTIIESGDRERQATDAADALGDAFKAAATSALRQNAPEEFRKAMSAMTDDGSVFIDAEVLNQMPVEILQQMQGVPEQIESELAKSGMVEVKLADALTLLAGTPQADVFMQNARATPDSLSAADAAQVGPELERMKAAAEQVMTQAQDQQAARAEYDAIHALYAGQLNDAGRFRGAVNDAKAHWIASYYTTMAARTGMTPTQFQAAHPLRVLGAPTGQGQVLNEGARPGTLDIDGYHFSTAARSTLSTAFYGTGLKGSAREEIQSYPDKRIGQRLSFYFDKGAGIRPESGVGGIAHRARLSNVYDADTDLLGLRTGDARAFETAVLDAGFSGYANRMDGTQPGQVIMLGPQTITPEVLGPRSKIEGGERPPALQVSEAPWQTQASGTAEQLQARLTKMQASPAWGDYDLRIEGDELQSRKKGGVFEQRAARPVPPAVAAAADIDAARVVAALSKWPTNRDFKLALQNAVRAAAGSKDLVTDSPEVRAYLAQQILKEARAALITNANAVGWYDEKVTTALEVVSAIHPELKTDQQARFAFIWGLAVTSNGVKVDKNFELAVRSYRHWKATGRMPTSGIGVGTAASKIHEGLATYNDLIVRWGYDRLRAFATTLQPNRQVAATFGRKVGGEGMDTPVYGAGILGPKIGNGFFMNLFGEFGQLTMDRWWVRMWGRLTGDLVVVDKAAIAAARSSFVSIIDMIKKDKTATRAVEQAIGTRLGKGDPIEMAKAIMKATTKKEVRDALAIIMPATPELLAAVTAARGKVKDFVSVADELRKSAKSFYMNLDGQIEAPGGARRRDMMRAVSQTVLAELQKDSPHLTMADFQALMWYPEKTLYDSAGTTQDGEDGYEDEDAPDYANAAIALARSEGVSDEGISAAIEQARSDIAARQRAGRGGRGTGDVPAQGSPGPGDAAGSPAPLAQDGGVDGRPQPTGDGAGRYSSGGLAPLAGAPTVAGASGPDARLVAVAEQYAASVGIDLRRQPAYVQVDPERGARIAAAYEAMAHAPNDPAVREAYDNLARQTMAQYQALLQAGYQFWFMDPAADPYAGNPWNAMRDLRANQSMAVFPSEAGFGSSEADVSGNPLLADTGLTWAYGTPDGEQRPVLFNDLFRAVHDAFGHGLEGAGFRAQGEENAWQAHRAMFTGSAVGAITSETRGQNSWLNFGPHGEKNQAAKVEDTVFADQKTGLMPEWTWNEGVAGDGVLNQSVDQTETPEFKAWFGDSKVVDENGAPLVVYHGSGKDFDAFDVSKIKPYDPDARGNGFNFSAETWVADLFAGKGGNVKPVYLSIKKPASRAKANALADKYSFDEWMARQPSANTIDDAVRLELQGMGYDGIRRSEDNWIAFRPEQIKSAIGNDGTFDANDPSILSQQAQTPRGTFNPKTLELVLNPNANLSTFFHETGHFFLEVMADIASQPGAPAQVVEDMNTFLKWAGIPDLATWNALDLDGKRPSHERWAESIEQYVMEGKAPSTELAPLMRRFAAWVKDAYKNLIAPWVREKDNPVQLNDDIRRVMDRMLATDEQIAQANEVAGLMPNEDADAEAAERLNKRSMRDLALSVKARDRAIADLRKEAKSWQKTITAEVTAEVDEMPVYMAKDAVERAVKETDTDPVAADAKLDSIATQYGYTSIDHMMREIENAQPKVEVIEGRVDQRMLEEHGDLIDERAIAQAANEAVHNAARARSLATELRTQGEMLNERGDTGRTNTKGSKITVNVLMEAARQFGANVVARTQVRNLRAKAWQHTAAEKRAGKAWQAATAAGKTAEAVKAKQDQVLNNAAAKAALDADAEVRKTLDYLKKFESAGVRAKLPAEYLDQIDKLLEAIDLRVSTTGKQIDRRASLQAWIDAQHAMGLDPVLPERLLADLKLTSYKEMTVEEFTELAEGIKNIEHLGRLKSKLLAAKDKREFDVIATEIADSIIANGGKKLPLKLEPDGRVKQFFKGAWIDHRKINSLVRQMDGGVDNGPFYRALIRSMNDAGAAENVMLEKATEALANLYAPIEKLKGGISGDVRFIPEIRNSLSRAGRLSVALNWGNPQNRQRVMDGDAWTEAQVNAILATLTPVELQFVNNVWEHIDSYWPEVKAKQMRVSGVVEDKVEAVPFELNGVTMRGGYYPIKYDGDRSIKAEKQEAMEAAAEIMRGAVARPTTRRGHTKARVDEVKGRPVKKDLSVITQHVNQVVHDLAWHEWFIDANRLLNDPRISSAIRDHHGPETARSMMDTANAIAVGDAVHQGQIDRLLLLMRSNVTRSIMGASLTTALLQPFGLTQSMARVGVVPVLKGAGRWAGDAAHMVSTIGWINEKSEFMRLRSKTFNRELREISQRVRGKSKFMQVADASLFFLMQKLQMVADVPTWVGAYEKALAGGVDESAAVALADEAVLGSQGGGTTKDLAAVQRNMPFLTQFYSYFSTTLNLVAEKTALTDFKNPRAVAGWLGDMALLAVIPAILPALITYLLKGGGEGDEPEDWAKKLAEWQASYLLGMFVGLRELPVLWSPFDYGGPPAAKLLNDGKRLVQQAGQGEIDDPAVLATIGFLGTALGIPTTQIIRSYKGWKAWDEGDAPPTSILFGPPPKN